MGAGGGDMTGRELGAVGICAGGESESLDEMV